MVRKGQPCQDWWPPLTFLHPYRRPSSEKLVTKISITNRPLFKNGRKNQEKKPEPIHTKRWLLIKYSLTFASLPRIKDGFHANRHKFSSRVLNTKPDGKPRGFDHDLHKYKPYDQDPLSRHNRNGANESFKILDVYWGKFDRHRAAEQKHESKMWKFSNFTCLINSEELNRITTEKGHTVILMYKLCSSPKWQCILYSLILRPRMAKCS